jgi:hypothetical protein
MVTGMELTQAAEEVSRTALPDGTARVQRVVMAREPLR